MKKETFKNSDSIIEAMNTNRGDIIHPELDLSPNARLAALVILSIRNPQEVSTDNRLGDVELF